MLQTIVKASELRHLTDARYFAACEVAYMGFSIGPGGLPLVALDAIREWVAGPQIIGEWPAASPLPSAATLASYRLDGLQLSSLESPAALQAASQAYGLPLLVEYVVEAYLPADAVTDFLAERNRQGLTFLLNFTKGGLRWEDLLAATPYSLAQLQAWTQHYPILLEIEGELPSKILAELPHLQGFAVRGGEEEKVGFKDFDALADFFEDLSMEE